MLSISVLFGAVAQAPLETFKYTAGVLTGENGSTGTGTVSTITDYKGGANNAIEFNGTQSLDYGNLALDATNGIGFTFWVKPNSNLSDGYRLFGKRSSCANTNTIQASLNGTSKTISLSVRTTGGLAMSVSTSYIENFWQQFTFTVSKTDGKTRAYRNGEYQSVSATAITPASIPNSFSGNFLVANGPCVGVDGTKKYQGGFDDLQIFNALLSDSDVITNYDAANYDDSLLREILIEQSLLIHHTFDSTLTNKVLIDDLNIKDHIGNENSALRVENDKVFDLGNPLISTANGTSFSFWIKPDVLTGSNIIFEKRSVCTWTDCFAVFANGTTNILSLVTRTSSQKASSVGLTYTPEVWQKVTFTIDNTAGKLYAYLNGVVKDSSNIVANSIPANFTTNSNITLGDGICNTTSETRYDGGIDELYIYEETLTPTQITDAYANDDDEQVGWVLKEDFNNLDKFYYQDGSYAERIDASTTAEETSLFLDGSTSYNLGNPGISTIASEGYSFSFWINPDASATGDQMLFSKRSSCAWVNMFAFRVNGGTNLVTSEFRTATQKVSVLVLAYTPGEWQRITYTISFEDKMLRGYRNGIKMDSVAFVGNEFVTNYSSANILLASDPCNVNKYIGGLDELKIYSLALEENEVLDKFQSELVVTDVFDNDEKESFTIYPNPAVSIINTEIGQIDVLDFMGNVVLSTVSTGKVDVSGLESGIYFVTQNGKSSKLIKE